MAQRAEKVMLQTEAPVPAGCCEICRSADYTQVCYRGKPSGGKDGLYCEPCFRMADED